MLLAVRRSSCVCVVPLLLAVEPAWAADGQDDTLRLTWTAPAGCPSSDDVRTATLRGADARGAKESGVLEAEARVEQDRGPSSSWRVRLRTRRGAMTGE